MNKEATIKTLQSSGGGVGGKGGEKGEGVKVKPAGLKLEVPRLGQAFVCKAQGAAIAAESQTQARAAKAPLDTVIEFVSALMSRDYEAALLLCKRIMEHEPRNKVAAEFYPLLLKKNIEAIENAGERSSESDEDSDNCTNSYSTASSSTSTCSDDTDQDTSSDLEESSDSDTDQDEDDDEDDDPPDCACDVKINNATL